jgi:hypothetical protein
MMFFELSVWGVIAWLIDGEIDVALTLVRLNPIVHVFVFGWAKGSTNNFEFILRAKVGLDSNQIVPPVSIKF